MNEHEVDARLKALFAEPALPPDPAFGERVVLLAAYLQAERRARRHELSRFAIEASALGAVLIAFALLARVGPASASFGDTVSLASPAMFGLAMLGLWASVGFRAHASFR